MPEDDFEWPGKFPSASTNAVTINIKTDQFPQESFWYLSKRQTDAADDEEWTFISGGSFSDSATAKLFSYTRSVQNGYDYRLTVLDDFADGMCCDYGFGYLTITSGVKSEDSDEGTVVYSSLGEFNDEFNAYFSVDENGVPVEADGPAITEGEDNSGPELPFPGHYPPPSSAENTVTVTLNIKPDAYPEEVAWILSKHPGEPKSNSTIFEFKTTVFARWCLRHPYCSAAISGASG